MSLKSRGFLAKYVILFFPSASVSLKCLYDLFKFGVSKPFNPPSSAAESQGFKLCSVLGV